MLLSKRWRLACLAPLLVLTACHGPYRRAPLAKGMLLDVVVSNSVMQIEKPEPTKVGGQYLVDYAFVLQNVGKQQVAFPLKDVVAQVDDLKLISYCTVGGERKTDLIVGPSERYRVDCQVQFSEELRFRLVRSDAQLTITVPITHAAGLGHFDFEYLLFKGDAG